MSSFEICADMIDLIFDLCGLYEPSDDSNERFGTIKLANGLTLYLKQLDSVLGLVCLIRTDNYEQKGWLDYNVTQFSNAMEEMSQKL
jgi:Ras-related GTP-binding protein C/D